MGFNSTFKGLKWHVDWKFYCRLALAINQIIRMLVVFTVACSKMKPSCLGPFGEDGYELHSEKWSLAETRVRVWSFCSVSRADFVTIFTVFNIMGVTSFTWRWGWSVSQGVKHHEDGDGVTSEALNTLTTRTESLPVCRTPWRWRRSHS